MIGFFKLKSPIGRSYNANPDDVLNTKRALHDLGYYHPPEWGMTPYPDGDMINGLEEFQNVSGLRRDGVMKPGGETEAALQLASLENLADAQRLQRMGRNGDTILAHINPQEARLLKARGGAGTRNPATGLLEFSKTNEGNGEKTGKYIWHTVGDGKVRSSHADRDGKEFDWGDPPEGGHPGEAPNCRCWAEDVDGDCHELQRQIENQKHTLQSVKELRDRIQKELESANENARALQDDCYGAMGKGLANIGIGTGGGFITGGPSGAVRAGAEASVGSILDTYDACSELDQQWDIIEEIKKRLEAAEKMVTTEEDNLESLWSKFADMGCKS